MRMRSAERNAITARGQFATMRGFGSALELRDLTPNGCRFTDRNDFLVNKTWIDLQVEGVGTCRANVRWRRNGEVGVAFDTPIPDHVFVSLREARTASRSAPTPASAGLAATRPLRFC